MRSFWFDTHPVSRQHDEPLEPGARWETVVAGAGLTGLTAAVLLARAGHQVAVLEARHTGAAATGNTTAKVSLLQGANYSAIRSHRSQEELRAYVDGSREAQAWLLRYLDERGVGYQRRTAYSYAHSDQGLSALEREAQACRAVGHPVFWTAETELPFPVAGAVGLSDQAQIHPTQVLQALTAELEERGGRVFEGVRVTDAAAGPALQVRTSAATVQAERLVLATGAPILDRGGHFAKLKGHRSYAQAYRLPSGSRAPQGMYLSVDEPHRSTRTADFRGEERLLIGGNSHVVGRAESPQQRVEDLQAWTQEHFPAAELTHTWSAQDYRSADWLPHFGKLPRGGDRIYVATGYNKWGMTGAVAAALALSAEILGGHMPWAQVLNERCATVPAVLTGAKNNAQVGAQMTAGWVSAELGPLPQQTPEEGRGVIGRAGGTPVGVSTVEGTTRRVSAVCPHMGGVLSWNDAECTWDCPLHASRFSADGTVLEGPAVRDLDASEDS